MKVLSTPSPYSLQGMSEKIHFQGFVCERSLQSYDLLAQDQFAGACRRRIRLVQLITPIIKNPATYPELSRKPDDVVARAHPFNGLSAELIAVPLPFLSLNFATPFAHTVHPKLPHSKDYFRFAVTRTQSTGPAAMRPVLRKAAEQKGRRETIKQEPRSH
jgi:hypothetical protein